MLDYARKMIASNQPETEIPIQLRHAVGNNVHDPAMWLAADGLLQADLSELGLRGSDVVEFVKSLPPADQWFHLESGKFHGRYRALSKKIAELRPDLVPGRGAASSLPSLRDRLPSHLRPAYAYAQASAEEREVHAARRAQLKQHHASYHWRTLRSACFAMANDRWPHRDWAVDLDAYMRDWTPAELSRVEALPAWIHQNAEAFVKMLEGALVGKYVKATKVLPDAREALAAQLSASRSGGALGSVR